MSYCTFSEVELLVGPDSMARMLDDNNDGEADAGLFDAIAAAASDQVDAYLSAQYAVPFSSPVPAFARHCAKVFTAETLYVRRGVAKDANPWSAQAAALRTRLEKIASGDEILDAATVGSSDSVEVQTEDSRFAQTGKTMMF